MTEKLEMAKRTHAFSPSFPVEAGGFDWKAEGQESLEMPTV